jgi:flavorubredoxin
LAHADAVNIAKRPVALFGSFGWSGEALGNLTDRLKGLKVNLFERDFRVVFVPTEEDLKNAKEFGKEFAKTF